MAETLQEISITVAGPKKSDNRLWYNVLNSGMRMHSIIAERIGDHYLITGGSERRIFDIGQTEETHRTMIEYAEDYGRRLANENGVQFKPYQIE